MTHDHRTMIGGPPVIETDVDRYAKVICDAYDALPEDDHRAHPSAPLFAGTTHMPPPEPACEACRAAARAVLAALTEDGRLDGVNAEPEDVTHAQ